MNQEELLRQALRGHEHLAPSAFAVAAGTRELARAYRRRRTVARTAGGAVVTAGLGAAVLAGPGLLDIGTPAVDRAVPFAAAPALPTPPPVAPQEQREAFFGAGYDYDDAVELARLWGLDPNGVSDVKAEAGRRLLAGEQLPVAPGTAPAAPAPPVPGLDMGPDDPYVAFLAAGYDWDDAVELARLWGSSDVLQTKADAGQKLLDGETLPIAP